MYIKSPNWKKLLSNEFNKSYFQNLKTFLMEEDKSHIICPSSENVFKAFNLTDYNDVRVVILGQDPYPNKKQATGLAFGVPNELESKPPSLLNIFKEIDNYSNIQNSSLEHWAKQGVLLLNTVLTVRESSPLSHKEKGWEVFTDKVISLLNDREESIIFVLWGNQAKKKKSLITNNQHYTLQAAHPSPLSAYNGFFGCGHFKKINELLNNNPIEWK